MKRKIDRQIFASVTLSILAFAPSASWALEDLVKSVQEGCKKELESYCKQVTPGEGRVLACLYAYQDKLSGRCEYALYDAAAQLERVVGALTYVANECGADLKKHCAAIQPGEGRLAQCLEKNKKDIGERCRQAMNDIRLEVK
jgi:cysteine rich repeat protein